MPEPTNPRRERWLRLEFFLLLAAVLLTYFQLFRLAWDWLEAWF